MTIQEYAKKMSNKRLRAELRYLEVKSLTNGVNELEYLKAQILTKEENRRSK